MSHDLICVLLMSIFVAHYSAAASADLSTLFDVGGIVGWCLDVSDLE